MQLLQCSPDGGREYHYIFSRIMDLYRQAEFPEGSLFLVTDRLINGCSNKEAKKKLMLSEKDVTIKQCLNVLKKQEALEASF